MWKLGRKSDFPAASRQFGKAAERDPDMSDAWLGLHASGKDEEFAIAGLVRHCGRFGEERTRTQKRLKSRFSLGTYCTWRLEYTADLWAAMSSWYIARKDLDMAAHAQAQIQGEQALSDFLAGRIAFVRGEHDRALAFFGAVSPGQDRFLGTEAQLISGALLVRAGAHDVARGNFNRVISGGVLGNRASGEAYYFLGLIDRAAGDDPSATANF